MARRLDFDNDKSSKLVNRVMQHVDEGLDNKKRDIPLELIDMNPDNEDIFGLEDIDYLAENINEDGFMGAIEVYALDNGRYEISSGHRRYLAMKQLGKDTIPCIVTENVDDVTKSKHLIKSNILNRKMTPMKWARTLEYYRDKCLKEYSGNKAEELARVFKMSKPTVKRLMALNKLSPELQPFADSENVSYLNLYAVSQLSEEDQLKVYEKLKKLNLDAENDNVFAAASKVVVEQNIRSVLEENSSLAERPNAKQVMNRTTADEEEKDNLEIPSITPNNKVMTYGEELIEEQAKDNFSEKFEQALAIDARLTVCIESMAGLFKGEYTLSDEVKEKAIEQLTEVLEILKA